MGVYHRPSRGLMVFIALTWRRLENCWINLKGKNPCRFFFRFEQQNFPLKQLINQKMDLPHVAVYLLSFCEAADLPIKCRSVLC